MRNISRNSSPPRTGTRSCRSRGRWFAIGRSSVNVPELHDPGSTAAVYKALVKVGVLVVTGALAFFGYLLWRPRRAELPILRLLKPLNRMLAPVWRKISPGLEADIGSDEAIDRDVGRLLLAALFVGFVLSFVAGAENVARVFSRSMAVPFILGGWLPFLGYLSGVGRACRGPSDIEGLEARCRAGERHRKPRGMAG